MQETQMKFLQSVRAGRDSASVDRTLAALTSAAAGTGNLMPLIIDAVKSYASVGEICNAMRTVFGEYKERVVV
jgi:methylmalonyl-CoA mutase, N-terminal domain